MNRCQILVIDNITNKHRKCKKMFKFEIMNKKCCIIHANSLYIKNIIKIQKVFRAYMIRKKTKYFIELPIDIQHKIITYIRDDFYINKQNQKIAKIILNKIDLFIKMNFYIPLQVNYLFGAIEFYNFQINNSNDLESYVLNTHPNANYLINHVLYLFYLLDKYHPIITIQKKFYINNYRNVVDVCSMFRKFLIIQKKILKCKNEIKNIENYKYIDCVKNFDKMYYH